MGAWQTWSAWHRGRVSATDDPGARLSELRRQTRERISDLQRELDGVMAASAASNADDEHDPEGATIAYEREQLAAMVAAARSSESEVEAAIRRVEDATYGRCVLCGAPIGPERLAARPATPHCVECARRR